MILFSTRTARHLAGRMALKQGACTIKNFSDGELFVQIDEDVTNKPVFVLASTQTPGDNMLELFFLLDALQRAGAHISLFISYFAYARQIVAAHGQALSAQVISNILREFTINHLYIMHVHSSTLLHELLPFTDAWDIRFFTTHAQQYDAIAAPDKGAVYIAQEVARLSGKELIRLTKQRYDDTTIQIRSVDGDVRGKRILLVDDMISTGHTVVQAAQELIKRGATAVAAAATHGVFSSQARTFLEQSVLEKIFVTNTIDQASHGKIVVTDIHAYIANIMEVATTDYMPNG